MKSSTASSYSFFAMWAFPLAIRSAALFALLPGRVDLAVRNQPRCSFYRALHARITRIHQCGRRASEPTAHCAGRQTGDSVVWQSSSCRGAPVNRGNAQQPRSVLASRTTRRIPRRPCEEGRDRLHVSRRKFVKQMRNSRGNPPWLRCAVSNRGLPSLAAGFSALVQSEPAFEVNILVIRSQLDRWERGDRLDLPFYRAGGIANFRMRRRQVVETIRVVPLG